MPQVMTTTNSGPAAKGEPAAGTVEAAGTPHASAQEEIARLVGIVANLREHCPWTAELTHDSLTQYLLEETYELIEAIEGGDIAEMSAELGDVLFQVVVHSRLAEENGQFALAEVARGINEKMIRRNPHVFHADGTLQESFPASIAEIVETWDAVKRAERAGLVVRAELVEADRQTTQPGETGASSLGPNVGNGKADAFSGIPVALPALALAQKTLDRAQRAGIATARPAHGTQSSGLKGEQPPCLESVQTSGLKGEQSMSEVELGELLFDVVRSAHRQGLDAERALRTAVTRFQGL